MGRHPGHSYRHRCGTASHRAAVAHAEAHFRAHMDTPMSVSTLCETVGLSERGLRDAFYRVRGMGPKQWMLAERLRCVRRVLSEERSGLITVTSVATDFGFFELGRFAGTYRRAFGEPPSQTLRGARQSAHVTQAIEERVR